MATFTKAVKDANLSVRIDTAGKRNVGGNAHMDGTTYQSNPRGGRGRGNRGGRGGRWQRGGFRGRGRGNRGRGGNSYHPRSRFEEDNEGDADMNDREGYEKKNRYNPYGGGRSHGGKDRSPERDIGTSDSGWWRITIPDGKKHHRDWLMRKLKQMAREPFSEVDVHNVQESLCFFVSEKSAAGALRSLSNRITTKDGSKIFISVKPSRNPPKNPNNVGSSEGDSSTKPPMSRDYDEVESDPAKIDVLKTCLGSRYHAEELRLDLTNLYNDSVLRSGKVDSRVFVPKFMNTVLKLVHELVPQLKVMDLSNNRLQRADILRKLPEMCPQLEELNLANNQLRSTNELSKFSEHKNITKLWLTENPVKEQFKADKAAYFSAVRAILPDLVELDGEVLPPLIKFDLQPESNIPKSVSNYFANKDASSLVVNFLKNFFNIYDLEDTNERQQLLPAYHSDAVFSMCCNTGVYQNDKTRAGLDDYVTKSRNLKRLKENSNARSQLIKRKKLGIVAHFIEFPSTKHQMDSFTLDVTLATPTCVTFTVKGIFFEGSGKVPRGFARTFVAIPESNSQFLIVNDQLQIRNPTEKQLEKLKGVPDTASVKADATTNQNTAYTPEQQELVKKFSLQSGMNLKFSLDALISNSWSYDQAALQFSELKTNGKIPAEAYAK